MDAPQKLGRYVSACTRHNSGKELARTRTPKPILFFSDVEIFPELPFRVRMRLWNGICCTHLTRAYLHVSLTTHSNLEDWITLNYTANFFIGFPFFLGYQIRRTAEAPAENKSFILMTSKASLCKCPLSYNFIRVLYFWHTRFPFVCVYSMVISMLSEFHGCHRRFSSALFRNYLLYRAVYRVSPTACV